MSSPAQLSTGSGVTTRSRKRIREDADRPAADIARPKRRRSAKPTLPSFVRRSPRHPSANISSNLQTPTPRVISSPRLPAPRRTADDTVVPSQPGATISAVLPNGTRVQVIDLTENSSKRKRATESEDESRPRARTKRVEDSATHSQTDRSLRAARRAAKRKTPPPSIATDDDELDEDLTLVNPPSDLPSDDTTDCEDSPLTTPEAEDSGWEEEPRKEVSLETEDVVLQEMRLSRNDIIVVNDPREQWVISTPIGVSVYPPEPETEVSTTSLDDALPEAPLNEASEDISEAPTAEDDSVPGEASPAEEEQPQASPLTLTRLGCKTGDGKYTPYLPTSNLAPNPSPRNRELPAHMLLLNSRKDTTNLTKDAIHRAAHMAQARYTAVFGVEELLPQVPDVAMDPHFVQSPEVDLFPPPQHGGVVDYNPPTTGYSMQLDAELDPALFLDNGLSNTSLPSQGLTSDSSVYSSASSSSWDSQSLSLQGQFGYEDAFGQSSSHSFYGEGNGSNGLLQSFPLMPTPYSVPFAQSSSLATHQLSLESSLAPMVDYSFADHSSSHSFLEQDVIERPEQAESCQARQDRSY
ncbi:hypothetical protein M422DRAFT_26731 [Sphaerobolus stellatus SS14]|nr:hypothetical protein M422DRAFT_26731 [Sphaerobolus stellatus SS14]